MAGMVHFLGFKFGVVALAQKLMEAGFIPLLVSFGYDKYTSYVKKQTSFLVRGKRKKYFMSLFWRLT